jgi:hypothetical protein
MISMLTFTARSLLSTLESIATPSSVKAYGGARRAQLGEGERRGTPRAAPA